MKSAPIFDFPIAFSREFNARHETPGAFNISGEKRVSLWADFVTGWADEPRREFQFNRCDIWSRRAGAGN